MLYFINNYSICEDAVTFRDAYGYGREVGVSGKFFFGIK